MEGEKMNSVSVGISRVSLKGCFDGELAFHDDLQAVVCYFSDAADEIAIITLDLTQLSVPYCDKLRSELSSRCGIDSKSIITHCTHTHTAPCENDLICSGMDKLAERLSASLIRAKERAEPAEYSFAEVDTSRRFNVNRRKRVEEADATFTTWHGYKEHQGEPDGTWLVKKRIAYMLDCDEEEVSLSHPVLYDGATDGWVQSVRFRSLQGKPIGTIIRYSAHPCEAGHTIPRLYSADFPGVVRKIISERYGGECCFLSGPCGNIAPRTTGNWTNPASPAASPLWVAHTEPAKCWEEVERLGRGIANAVIPAMDRSNTFTPLKQLTYVSKNLTLPVREDILENIDDAHHLADEYLRKFQAARGHAALPELKELADRIRFFELHKAFYHDYYYLTAENCQRREINIDLPAIRIGDVILSGLPGEAFWETSQSARDYAIRHGLKLISFTEANGDIGYIPTPAEKVNDDYECCCSILARNGEPIIAKSVRDLLEALHVFK